MHNKINSPLPTKPAAYFLLCSEIQSVFGPRVGHSKAPYNAEEIGMVHVIFYTVLFENTWYRIRWGIGANIRTRYNRVKGYNTGFRIQWFGMCCFYAHSLALRSMRCNAFREPWIRFTRFSCATCVALRCAAPCDLGGNIPPVAMRCIAVYCPGLRRLAYAYLGDEGHGEADHGGGEKGDVQRHLLRLSRLPCPKRGHREKPDEPEAQDSD